MKRSRRPDPLLQTGSVVDQLGRLLIAMRAVTMTTQDDDRYPVNRDALVDTVTQWADHLEAVLARLVPPPPEQP